MDCPECESAYACSIHDVRTIDVGYVHTQVMINGQRICTDNCPHPDHAENVEEPK